MIAELVLRAVVGVLAAYHVGIGIVSVASPRLAARAGGALYALEASETPQLRYGVRMLGLYALALGALLTLAAWRPRDHLAVIVVVAGLQLARAVTRLALRHELAAAFRIPPRRNVFNAAVLVVEAAALAACLAVVR